MALNIKNKAVEALAAEVSSLTGESKTEAIRNALLERKARVSLRVVEPETVDEMIDFLERDVWSSVPARQLGRRLSKREWEKILGYDTKDA